MASPVLESEHAKVRQESASTEAGSDEIGESSQGRGVPTNPVSTARQYPRTPRHKGLGGHPRYCCRARRMRPERAELSKVVEGKGPGVWDLPIIQLGGVDGEAHIGGAVTTP